MASEAGYRPGPGGFDPSSPGSPSAACVHRGRSASRRGALVVTKGREGAGVGARGSCCAERPRAPPACLGSEPAPPRSCPARCPSWSTSSRHDGPVCGLPVGQVLPERARARGPGGAPDALNYLAPPWGLRPRGGRRGDLPYPLPGRRLGCGGGERPAQDVPDRSQLGPRSKTRKGGQLCHGANQTGVP